jgi:hypothetical protein
MVPPSLASVRFDNTSGGSPEDPRAGPAPKGVKQLSCGRNVRKRSLGRPSAWASMFESADHAPAPGPMMVAGSMTAW